MEITEVRIKLMEDSDDRLQAFCSITFDNCFVIRDLKIIDGTNGLVCEPLPEAVAAAIDRLAADRRLAAALGDSGFDAAKCVTWDGVIERLLSAA